LALNPVREIELKLLYTVAEPGGFCGFHRTPLQHQKNNKINNIKLKI